MFLLFHHVIDMRGSLIAVVVSGLASMVHSSPLILSDEGNAEDPLNNSLYFTPIDQTADEESVLDSIATGSFIELPLESDPAIWRDYTSPELDIYL